MNRFENLLKPPMWSVALLLAAFAAGCGSSDSGGGSAAATPAPTAPGAGTGVGGAGQGPAPVNLGGAGTFVILAQSAITDVPTSAVTGDVGLSPRTGADIGLTCVEVTGVMYSVDAAGPACAVMNPSLLTAAIDAKGTAYTDANGRAPDYTEVGAGNIGGMTLPPAVYKWGTGVLIPTDVTLSG
ncbi:MAG TPA: ice-binding family protein, partial [Burkholderiales bacterium]|nr:ice-binding family protein [Burkholderiales bacterium]